MDFLGEDIQMDLKIMQTLLRLPVAERISLVGDIWDSLRDEDIPTPPALRKKLREQLSRYRANPEDILTYEEFRRRSNQLLKGYTRKGRRSA